MNHPTTLARERRGAGPSLAILVIAAVVAGCATSAAPSSSNAGGPGSTATAAASRGASAAPSTAPTSAPSAAGPKATTCRELLSDSEVRQATGLGTATLKSVDVTVAIVNETHCRFDAGSTTVEVSVWSGDRLSAFDSLSSAQSNPVTLDVAGATATFYDLSFLATGLARTADHGVAVTLTPGDTPIPDMKAAATALLRLAIRRI